MLILEFNYVKIEVADIPLTLYTAVLLIWLAKDQSSSNNIDWKSRIEHKKWKKQSLVHKSEV